METHASPKPHFSARSLLPLGFCAVFLLMAAALVESYRMQASMQASPAALSVYDQADGLLERVRHGFNQSQSVVRDFLLRATGSELYLADLSRCESEVKEALEPLARMPDLAPSVPEVRARFAEQFQSLREIALWPEEKRKRAAADYLAVQLPRLRASGNRALRETAEASQTGRKRIGGTILANCEAIMRRILILLGADLILALAVAGLNLVYAHELGRESLAKVGEIARAKTEMQQLSGRLLSIQEEERHRLSRDLHDGIGQLLTALRIEISHLGQEGGGITDSERERLRRARSLAEEAVRNTRDIALLLRPSHLDDLGLEAALQWHAEDFSRRTGIPCHFSALGLQEQLPEAWKTCVYRIVQEALHNCEKHAAPTQVQVRLCQEPELLTLEVQDDGVGFELDASGAPARAVGLGLLGMRERAAMLGGALQMISAPGRGTRVRVALPISPLLPRALPAPAADGALRPEVEA
jgi:signal transduction histidine kinase